MGPVGHFWYSFLDKIFPKQTVINTIRKILFDQLLASPIFTSLVIFGTNIFDGRKYSDCYAIFKEKFFTIYTVNLDYLYKKKTIFNKINL